jgi:hypothetical protein
LADEPLSGSSAKFRGAEGVTLGMTVLPGASIG